MWLHDYLLVSSTQPAPGGIQVIAWLILMSLQWDVPCLLNLSASSEDIESKEPPLTVQDLSCPFLTTLVRNSLAAPFPEDDYYSTNTCIQQHRSCWFYY